MKNKLTNNGFILLEAAIFIAILAICSLTVTATYNSMKQYTFIKDIQKKEEALTKMLAGYLMEHGHLPMACVDGTGLPTPNAFIGDIPYKTLNIPLQMTKDNNGNSIKYIVSKVCTQSNVLVNITRNLEIANEDIISFCEIDESDIQIISKEGTIQENGIICFVLISAQEFDKNKHSEKIFTESPLTKWVSKSMLISLYCGINCN